MITFDWYAKMKYNIDDYVETFTGKSILVEINTLGSKPTLLSTACFTTAGAITGFGVSFLACPFELLKVGRQMGGMMAASQEHAAATAAAGLKNPLAAAAVVVGTTGASGAPIDEKLSRAYRDKGTFKAGLDLYRRIGIRGLYSGIHLHASKLLFRLLIIVVSKQPANYSCTSKVRDTVGTGIFWGSYEGVKQLLSVSRGLEPDNPLAGGFAGGLCGMLAYLCVRNLYLLFSVAKVSRPIQLIP
jgi:solute carrier family 25 (mitochondrial carnitine/acylcarnitine transporter), member 20/29